MPPSMMPMRFDAKATSAVGPVPLNEPAKTRFARNTGRKATMLASAYRNGREPIERNASWGMRYASNRAATSTAYSGTEGLSGKRELRKTASITLHRMAKNTSEFTSQGDPNRPEEKHSE